MIGWHWFNNHSTWRIVWHCRTAHLGHLSVWWN